jgi:hypothetical protein
LRRAAPSDMSHPAPLATRQPTAPSLLGAPVAEVELGEVPIGAPPVEYGLELLGRIAAPLLVVLVVPNALNIVVHP